MIGVDAGKEIVVSRLRLDADTPGACHFPVGRDLEYFRQLGSERIVRSYTRGVAVRRWQKDPSVRNEALDCRVYAYAALCGLIVRGFRLDQEAARIADLPLRDKAPAAAPKANVIRSKWMDL